MQILFLTIGAVKSFNNNGAYTDLLKRFSKEGHKVYVVGAVEKRENLPTTYTSEYGINILNVRVGNITKTNLIEKGISTLTIGKLYNKAISKYLRDVKFDLILYSTPPITIVSSVKKMKKKHNAKTYLMLKDIFPQNAMDIGILSSRGIKGLIFKYFCVVENRLYNASDKIGCMSQANVDYMINNTNVNINKLEICPNTIDLVNEKYLTNDKKILNKYAIPNGKHILLYGGNFGRPQNVDYIIEAIDRCKMIENVHFVLCGSGTDFYKIEDYCKSKNPKHVTLIKHLPYEEYIKLIQACDVGLLFLDYRFTIPNFPSRLLDYINYGLPIIAATDCNTDVGKTIEQGEFGWWIESRNPECFERLVVDIFSDSNFERKYIKMSFNAREYLINNFETGIAYSRIVNSIN